MSALLLCAIFLLSPRHFFTYAKRRLEKQQVGLLNRVVASRAHLFSIRSYISFLHDCLESAVAPSHIKHRIRRARLSHTVAIEKIFIKDELAKSKDRLSKAKCDFYDGYRQAKTSLQMTDFLRFSWLLAECDQKQRITNEEKYAKTLKFLRKEREENYSNIINLTDIELTSAQKAILSKGMDFCLPPYLVEEHVCRV